MAKYKQYGPALILQTDPVRQWINGPTDPNYAAFKAWVTAGNTPDGADGAADPPLRQQLSQADQLLGTVLSDLIQTLVTKGVLKLTDFPASTQAIIAKRKSILTALNGA